MTYDENEILVPDNKMGTTNISVWYDWMFKYPELAKAIFVTKRGTVIYLLLNTMSKIY